jgi:hypothetical protein
VKDVTWLRRLQDDKYSTREDTKAVATTFPLSAPCARPSAPCIPNNGTKGGGDRPSIWPGRPRGAALSLTVDLASKGPVP